MGSSTEGPRAGFAWRPRPISARPSRRSWPQEKLHRKRCPQLGTHNCVWLGRSPGYLGLMFWWFCLSVFLSKSHASAGLFVLLFWLFSLPSCCVLNQQRLAPAIPASALNATFNLILITIFFLITILTLIIVTTILTTATTATTMATSITTTGQWE